MSFGASFEKGEKRWRDGGAVVLMAFADNYVMARRPGSMPFVMYKTEWENLSDYESGKWAYETYHAAKGGRTP